MKNGFFLLEALLASALLCIFVGSIIHHYGQWSRSYRRAVLQGNALSELMSLLERGIEQCSDHDIYNVSKQSIDIDEPVGSFLSIPSVLCPHPQCIEMTLSWKGDGSTIQKISAITGIST